MEGNIIFWNPWWNNETIEVRYRGIYDESDMLIKRKEVIFFSGVRRSGKTYYLYHIINSLLPKVKPENILYLNMDDEVLQFKTLSEIYDKYREMYPETEGRIYIFLDEIQNIENWERWVKNIYDSSLDIKIFITGSNASILKKNSARLLTGRIIEKVVYPLSFSECLELEGIEHHDMPDIIRNEHKIRKRLKEYLRLGGFPEVVMEPNERERILLLKNYFESIRDKDIVASFNLRESAKFERLAHYLISNTARFVSAKRIGGIIGLSTTAVNNYLDYAEQVYWFLQLKNFSFSIKGQITSQRKIYAIDTGFITSTAFSFSENIGRILENIIFLQLKMDEKNIYFHKESKECDFIIKQGTKVIQAIQVAYDLKDEDTRKREIDGLIDAMDHHGLKSGLIITSEEEGTLKIDGKKIKIMKAWKWLLSGR